MTIMLMHQQPLYRSAQHQQHPKTSSSMDAHQQRRGRGDEPRSLSDEAKRGGPVNSSSRSIKIQRRSNQHQPQEEAEQLASAAEYDMATWRMYERIIRHRRNRKSAPSSPAAAPASTPTGTLPAATEPNTTFRFPMQYHNYYQHHYPVTEGEEEEEEDDSDRDEPIFDLEL